MTDRVHLGVLSPGSIAVRASGEVALCVVAAHGVGFSVELARLRGLIDALKAAGVAVVGTRAVHDALRAHESAIDVSVTAEIEARLAERGLAPYPYQREGIAWLLGRESHTSALLGDDMGLGKSMQLLCSLPLSEPPPVLVVCPALARSTWVEETELWRPDYRHELLAGRGSFRWPQVGEIVITHSGLLPPSPAEAKDLRRKAREATKAARKATKAGELEDAAKHAATANRATAKAGELEAAIAAVGEPLPGTRILGDEVHVFMNPKAQRTKRMRALIAAAVDRRGKVRGATGTNMLNEPPELWNVLLTLRLAEEAFGRWPDFCEVMNSRTKWRWASIPDPEKPGKKKAVKKPAGLEWGIPHPEARERLARVQLRRLKGNVLTDLPPKRRQRILVELKPATRRLCEAGRKALRDGGIDLERATAEALESAEKLPEFRAYAEACAALAAAKLDAVLELVEQHERDGIPLGVVSRHRAPIDAIGARAGWGKIVGGMPHPKRDETRKAFQAGKLKGIALTIGAGGVALTLTHGQVVILIDRAWSPAVNDQVIDRFHRIGQTASLLVLVLVADHALDLRQDQLLKQKRERMDAIETATAPPAPPAAPRECRPEPPRPRRAVSKTKDLSGIGPLFDGGSR